MRAGSGRKFWQACSCLVDGCGDGQVRGSEFPRGGRALSEVCEIRAADQKWQVRKVGWEEMDEKRRFRGASHSRLGGSSQLFHTRLSVCWATLLLSLGGKTFESHWSRETGVAAEREEVEVPKSEWGDMGASQTKGHPFVCRRRRGYQS